MNQLTKERGFTLLEIIVSILLVGVVAAIMGVSGAYLAKSFIAERTNADTLLKGQIAMSRIQKELNNVKKVSASSTSSITFSSYRDTGTANNTVTLGLNGANLLLNNFILADKVNNFSLAYYNSFNSAANTVFSANTRLIDVNLVITGWENLPFAFNIRVAPSFDVSTGT